MLKKFSMHYSNPEKKLKTGFIAPSHMRMEK